MSFCGHCGTRVPSPEVAGTSPQAWSCRECGGANPEDTAFCGFCGSRWKSAGVEDVRLVTALFADISGFTALADTLSVEALHGVIRPLIAGLAHIADKYGGFINKYAGDALLVVFGAPVAHEDDPQRALLTALEMHEELPRLLALIGPAADGLTIHVGVNTGRVVAGRTGSEQQGDYSVLGDSVILAQRLESVCPGGQTYVGATTYELCRDEFDMTPLGELTLKGKAAPVAAWRLEGRRVAPARSSGANTHRLLGREAELAAVLAVLDRVQERGGFLAVTAEPGAGKSRLAEEAQQAAEQRNLLWLEGRALSYGASLPYWPFVDLLRRVFRVRIDHDPYDASSRTAQSPYLAGAPEAIPYFLRLLGLPTMDDGRIDAMSPEAFQRGLVDVFLRWFTALSDTIPVVLLVEDVHWLDSASQELLRRLVRASRTLRLVVYVTGRPEAAAAVDELTALAEGLETTRVVLGPLDRAAVDALVAAVFQGSVDPEINELVAARTSGNPFFVEELVRSLRSGGAVLQDGVWTLSPGWDATSAPATVEGVLAARIDRLPRQAAAILQIAAVIGRRPDMAVLEEVAGTGPVLHSLIAELVETGFLNRVDVDGKEQLIFHHAMVVDVAYGRMVHSQRVEVHRRVAEAAEVLYGTADDVVDLLARHLYLAQAGVKAVDYLQRAAARAQRLFANDQAKMHLLRALELTRATERLTSRLPTLLLDVADVEELTADYDGAMAHFEEARRLGNDIRAWRGCASVLRKRGRCDESLELIDSALASGDELYGQDVAPLWLERAALLVYEGKAEDAVRSAREGLAATTDPQGPVAAELLLRLARALEAGGAHKEALSHALHAVAILQARHDPRGLAMAYRVVGALQAYVGSVDEAVATLRRGLELAEQTGSAEEIGGCLINLGMAELSRGRPADGALYDERAIALFEDAGNRIGVATGHGNLAEKLLLSEEYQRAWEHGTRALEMAHELGARWTIADVHQTLALCAVANGNTDDALVHCRLAQDMFAALGDDRRAEQVALAVDAALDEAGQSEGAPAESARAPSGS